jgi:hypothetical protein
MDKAPANTRGHLILAAGLVSAIGEIAIRFVMNLPMKFVTTQKFHAWPGLDTLLLSILAGLITGILFVPLLLHRIYPLIVLKGQWMRQCVRIGALAGFCNCIILAFLHLSIMYVGFVVNPPEGMTYFAVALQNLQLFLIYLPVAGIIDGIPAAFIGALAGIGAGLFIKRTALRGTSPSG